MDDEVILHIIDEIKPDHPHTRTESPFWYSLGAGGHQIPETLPVSGGEACAMGAVHKQTPSGS